jgi:hypothetical protein
MSIDVPSIGHDEYPPPRAPSDVGISAQGYGNMLATQTVGDQIGSAMQQQAERCPRVERGA